MNGPQPTPFQAYTAARYHYPLFEILPDPLRVPVKGPPPFNMMAVVQTRVWITEYGWADDKLTRRTLEVPTSLTVNGVDPLAPERHPVQHSSTGTIRMMQTADDTSFVIALDRIHPGSHFDSRGRWWFGFDVADQFDNVFSGAHASITSWVLCFDSATPRPPHRRPRRPGPGRRRSREPPQRPCKPSTGLDDSRPAEAEALVTPMLDGYRRFVADGGDVGRVLQDRVVDLVKPLLAAHLPDQALAITRAHLDLLEGVTPGNGSQRAQHLLDLANARHNLVARLLDSGRTDEAKALVPTVVRDYRAYTQQPEADLVEAIDQLRAFKLVVESAALTEASAAVTAAIVDLSR